MGQPSLRARIASWIGGKALKGVETAVPHASPTEEGLPDRDALPLLDRVRVIEAEMLDLSVQWSDLNDAVRKWSARLASQKAAETRKSLAAISSGGDSEQLALDGPEAATDVEGQDATKRAAMKAELARRWANRRR